jgi:hypothetical protein
MEITYRELHLDITGCSITITDFGTINANRNTDPISSTCNPTSQVLSITFSNLVDLFNYDVDNDPLWLTTYEFTFEVTLTLGTVAISFKTLDSTYLDIIYKTSYVDTTTIFESFYSTANFVSTSLA